MKTLSAFDFQIVRLIEQVAGRQQSSGILDLETAGAANIDVRKIVYRHKKMTLRVRLNSPQHWIRWCHFRRGSWLQECLSRVARE